MKIVYLANDLVRICNTNPIIVLYWLNYNKTSLLGVNSSKIFYGAFGVARIVEALSMAIGRILTGCHLKGKT